MSEQPDPATLRALEDRLEAARRWYHVSSGTYDARMGDAELDAPIAALRACADAQERPQCGAENGAFRCNLAAGHDGCHEDRNQTSGGAVGWAPAAPSDDTLRALIEHHLQCVWWHMDPTPDDLLAFTRAVLALRGSV